MHRPKIQPEFPWTHHCDVGSMMEQLDHHEMTALAAMFERWAITEPEICPDVRTKLIQWSTDLERVAAYCGREWRATGATAPTFLQFVAREELKGHRPVVPRHLV